MDWRGWHDKYDDPGSPMARRLRTVQARIRIFLDESGPGPLTAISLCAGQGRDLLEVLAAHPRGGDVRARLVELDPGNVSLAREMARAGGPAQVEVVAGDASLTDHYGGLAPADLVLICGVFGNITDEDIRRTIGACPQLCRTGGAVIWTRHRRAPDRAPLICDGFEQGGFRREWLSDDADYAVGVHRLMAPSRPLAKGARLFNFVGYDRLET